jgi:hypothetical protein
MTIKRRMGAKRVTDWDKVFGMKGEGKTASTIPFAKDIISQFANPVSKKTSFQQTSNTGDNAGSWTVPNTSQPFTSQPYQNPYIPSITTYPYGRQQGWYGSPIQIQQQKPLQEKPKHDPKELAGKMVAYATVRVQGIEHTGVLFVRRCGAWKLIDCRTMNKAASGSEKSPLPDVTIHYIIYAEETDTKPKKKSRFDDIGMRIEEEIDKDGTTT